MEKYPISKKAYMINMAYIHEGYLCADEYVYADNINKAKSLLLKEAHNLGIGLRYSDEEISYINIPVARSEQYDLYVFEGEELSRSKIEEILNDRARANSLNEILCDSEISHCYIMKRGQYYRPNSCGYTDFKTRAGIYTKEEAVIHAKGCDEIYIKAINVSDHNKMLQDEISEMQSRMIDLTHHP